MRTESATLQRPVLELDSERTPVAELLGEALRRRELLPLLARQHFHGTFRAARLGVLWSALQPLIRGAVLAVVFTQFVPIESGNVAYPIFVLTGTTVWTFMSQGLISGTTSIVTSASIAGRVYFPRLLLPAMPATSNLPSYLATIAVVLLLGPLFGAPPSARLLALPAVLLLSYLLTVAASAVLSLMFVYFRDVGQMVQAVVSVAFYVTPVIYLPEAAGRYQILLEANPFTGAIALARWSLVGSNEALLRPVTFTLAWTLGFVVAGIAAFSRHERICVDRL